MVLGWCWPGSHPLSSVMWRIETRFDVILYDDCSQGPLGTLGRGNLTQAPHPASGVLLLYRANIFYCQECNSRGCVLNSSTSQISTTHSRSGEYAEWKISFLSSDTGHVLTPGCDTAAVTSHLTWSQLRPDGHQSPAVTVT